MLDVASLVQAASVFFASWAVISGVNAWKREFIGKRKIELAEQVLAKFFEVRDAVSSIRSPFSSSDEGKTRKKVQHETPDESIILDRAYIVNERFEKYDSVFSEFYTLKYRSMATFGKDVEIVFIEMTSLLRSILASATMLGSHYWQRQGRVEMGEDEFAKHLKEMHHHEKIFWDHGSSDDEIRAKLDNVLKSLEKILGPCFEEPMTLYTMLTAKLFKKDC